MGKKGKKKTDQGEGSKSATSQESRQAQQQQQQQPQQQQQRPQQQQQQPQQQQQWPQQQQQRPQQQQQQPQQQQQRPQQQQQRPQQQQQQPQQQQQRPQQQQQQPQQQQQWPQQQQQRPQQQQQQWSQQQQPQQQQQRPQQQQQQQQQRPQQQQQWPQQQQTRPQQQQQQWPQQQQQYQQQQQRPQQQQPQQQQQRPQQQPFQQRPQQQPQQQQQPRWPQPQQQQPQQYAQAPQASVGQITAGVSQMQVSGTPVAGAWGKTATPTVAQQAGGDGPPGQPQPKGKPQPQQGQSRPESRASSVSVKSADSSETKAAGKVAGSSPVKTSLSTQMQLTYINQIPKRKNLEKGGTKGRPITVQANMIALNFGSNFKTSVVHYDVKFEPDKPRFMYRPVVEAVRMKKYPNRYPVFDGRCNLYAANTLPFGDSMTTEVEVENIERQSLMTFKVTITMARYVDMSLLRTVRPGFVDNENVRNAMQALDIILSASAIRQRAIPVGRSYFSPPKGQAVDLGNGMDLWVGTFQSVVLGWKPYFNVDVAHKAFPRNQPVLELFNNLCGDSRSGAPATARDIEYGKDKLNKFLKGLKVTYEIPGHPTSKRTMGINGLARSARDATFQLADGTTTTVQTYFAREKQYMIKHPDLPTLWVGSRNKQILIPAELCIIEPGQVTNRKMDERQTSAMVKYAATSTDIRKKKIMEGFDKMRYNQDPASKEFGITVGTEFETVKARVLDPPPLSAKGRMLPKKGVWRQMGFYSSSPLPEKSWTILNLNNRTAEGAMRELVSTLQRAGKELGMEIGNPVTPFKTMRAPSHDVREIINFFNEKKEEKLKLIIVIVPDKTGPVYGKVKQVAELNVGVLTQCLKAITVERKMNPATAANILLKVNSKLNGTNQIISAEKTPPCLKEPCIIVGADVTHPSPDAVGIPSIAAVAASHGPRAFKYNVKIRLQPPKTEIILHLEEIMKEQLIFFYKKTSQKPLRIIFYRDGVSEGQFPQVMHHELQAIRNACKRLGGDTYQPKITFLVVQKRHHIRLFPTDSRNSDDRNNNVQAGTVVDTEITHPSHIDFYLVSHASIQGTARPTKYRCLWDDSNMSEDEIEELTYYLCHMFSRCSRSVSYPAPTYYAHLAAFRARALTNEVDIFLNNLEEEQRKKMTIKEEILLGNPMFFV